MSFPHLKKFFISMFILGTFAEKTLAEYLNCPILNGIYACRLEFTGQTIVKKITNFIDGNIQGIEMTGPTPILDLMGSGESVRYIADRKQRTTNGVKTTVTCNKNKWQIIWEWKEDGNTIISNEIYRLFKDSSGNPLSLKIESSVDWGEGRSITAKTPCKFLGYQ